jgi:hypothetical protein
MKKTSHLFFLVWAIDLFASGWRNSPTRQPIYAKRLISSAIDLIFSKLDNQLKPKSGIFFNDKIFDAYVFSSELISKAKKSIILIDNYIDETTLLQLSKRNKKVQCIIYTERITAQLKLDLEKHNAQYAPIEILILKNAHDRFLIIDETELYHLGASLKDLGKRWFAFSRMDSFVSDVLNHLR